MTKPQPPNDTAPAEAFRFAADLTVAAGEADGAGVPITIRARSPRPIQHAFWGLVVHDMAGMILDKETIPLDYNHDCDDILGFADKFDAGDDGLDVSGKLIPYVAGDRASEVIFKSRARVPYQGSINFAGDGIQLEFIGDGQVAQVNGYQLAGPATIIRKWPLRSRYLPLRRRRRNRSTSQIRQSNPVHLPNQGTPAHARHHEARRRARGRHAGRRRKGHQARRG